MEDRLSARVRGVEEVNKIYGDQFRTDCKMRDGRTLVKADDDHDHEGTEIKS
jgi:hypothetical protein